VGDVEIRQVALDSDKVSPRLDAGNAGRAGRHEWIENGLEAGEVPTTSTHTTTLTAQISRGGKSRFGSIKHQRVAGA
jgi:hypothetical protein